MLLNLADLDRLYETVKKKGLYRCPFCKRQDRAARKMLDR